MKLSIAFFAIAPLLVKTVSADFVWTHLLAGGTYISEAVRRPPTKRAVTNLTSPDIVCNVNGMVPAKSTVTVVAGAELGFAIHHIETPDALGAAALAGTAAIYLARVPEGETADTWDVSGAKWFKIAAWGDSGYPTDGTPPEYGTRNLYFEAMSRYQLYTTIPNATPSGEYIARIEYLSIESAPHYLEIYISCAQIKIVGGGNGTPGPLVSIPGHLDSAEPGINFQLWTGKPTTYPIPGVAEWRG